MKYFWKAWPAVKRKLEGRKKLLLVDFDGTLVSIARTPDAVRLRRRTVAHLDAISKRRDCRVAVISGRSLKDLRRFFSLKRVDYIGNHGLEMSGRGLSTPTEARDARRLKFLMWLLVEKLSADFCYLPGILVEDKGLTVSLHFRNLAKEHSPAFHEVLNFFKKSYKDRPLVWKKGKKVWEIFPKVRWHKGFAAARLFEKHPDAFPIVIGDDRTDEDMFKAMHRFGVTIRVGHSQKSYAQYYLKSQKEVERLLEELAYADR